MKHIIAVYGTRNVGKTTVIKMALDFLKERYTPEFIEYIHNGTDVIVAVTIVVTINGVRCTIIIIFASAGDTPDILRDMLEKIRNWNYDILICATKTRGGTVDVIEDCQPRYPIMWVQKASSASNANEIADNERTAREILKKIEECLLTR